MTRARKKTIILFPYSGYAAGSGREELFWNMVERCRRITGDERPVVVVNADTEGRGEAEAFRRDQRSDGVDAYRVWSVDTCQMWLAGWGHVLDGDDANEVERIIQLPGDIDWVVEQGTFFQKLDGFLALGDSMNLVIGDFEAGGRFNAKDLIDYYGTYALMANWFPEVTNKILQMPLNRPRSEFLNIDVETLRRVLKHRKFAYEQTLNILIRLWDFESRTWQDGIGVHSHSLGTLRDDAGSRQYRECLDQIERTERMLKMLWREINWSEDGERAEAERVWERYHELDHRSTAVRQNARIIIGNLLKVGS
jgi:hypothetical protein